MMSQSLQSTVTYITGGTLTLSPTSPDKPKKNCTKKTTLFLASMGETGLSHDIFFFEFSLRPFEVAEVE